MVVITANGIGAGGTSGMDGHAPGLAHCHALIVDPNINNRRLLQTTLQDLRCGRVVGVGEEKDAWAELDKGGLNIVFLDWSDAMDAPAMLQRLRGSDSAQRYVPVVVVTNHGGVADVMRVRDAGATEFIVRPFSKEVVASRLRAIVHAPRPFVKSGTFFGPDRRRHHLNWSGQERRHDRDDDAALAAKADGNHVQE